MISHGLDFFLKMHQILIKLNRKFLNPVTLEISITPNSIIDDQFCHLNEMKKTNWKIPYVIEFDAFITIYTAIKCTTSS